MFKRRGMKIIHGLRISSLMDHCPLSMKFRKAGLPPHLCPLSACGTAPPGPTVLTMFHAV